MEHKYFPFSHIRILDLSRLLPGPLCSMLFADFGAEVIKIEDPRGGDYIRSWPPLAGKNSGYHLILNRNKKSVTLNLKDPRGQEIFRKLAKTADVVIESFRPGVMDRLGIGYEVLSRENPRLIYCAITGYGQTGRYALRAGHDINYLAISGVLSYSGKDGKPVLPGVQIGDVGAGALLAAFSIVMALYTREKTGKGDFIDISMTDGLLLFHALRWGKFIVDRKTPIPGDDILNHGLACYNIYKTKDGRYMALGALEPKFWEAFCKAVGRPEWIDIPHFEPGEHQKELKEAISKIFAEKTQKEWIAFFEDIDCCCEPVRTLDEVINDEELKMKGAVVPMMDTYLKIYNQLGVVFRCKRIEGAIKRPAPELGEHTHEILEAIGLSSKEIEELRREGVI